MRYFKAIALENKPFIQWDGWANSIEELAEMEEYTNPLIIAEDQIPPFLYNVCPLKVVAGELVDRTIEEMAAFEEEYGVTSTLNEYARKVKVVNAGSFSYDGNHFPMHEVARLRYMAIRALSYKAADVMTSTGDIVTIVPDDIQEFLEEYYAAIDSITNPNTSEE